MCIITGRLASTHACMHACRSNEPHDEVLLTSVFTSDLGATTPPLVLSATRLRAYTFVNMHELGSFWLVVKQMHSDKHAWRCGGLMCELRTTRVCRIILSHARTRRVRLLRHGLSDSRVTNPFTPRCILVY